MQPEQIRSHLRRQPFQPIRVFLSDGSAFDIEHPEFAAVSMGEVAIAVRVRSSELPDQMVYVAPEHVSRIELANGTRPAKASDGSEKQKPE